MTHPNTSTDRDREAVDAVSCSVGLHDDEAADVLVALRRLGWSAPYDEPTEAMVEAACLACNQSPASQFLHRNRMRAALVAAARARGNK